MRRLLSLFLSVTILFTCALIGIPNIYAATKANDTRTIAIVFDNSGSMYDEGDMAWCRATYAMEVFASMLNAGDKLLIYPMHPITVQGKEYSMQTPFQITDSTQAALLRSIYTTKPGGTPIESIDCAVSGLQAVKTGKKYLIVLTDGGTFYKDGHEMSKDNTKKELDSRIQKNAGKSLTVMYLGIGSEACVPDTKESDYFVKKQAVNTADVLSTLTDMCNLIFGRDTLPKNRISGKNIEFDISMRKLILLVQGENISNLNIKSASGSSSGKVVSSQQVKYATDGAGIYECKSDTSLQGMMVICEDFNAGNYTIEYGGTASSVEVYYEPDADLDFIFTDSEGNNVDPNALYEGEYKVSFGMKDAKTGKLITSDLLGNPHYEGIYYINDQEKKFNHDGLSGEVPVSLKMNDSFEANLTVTYLSGYTISKDSTDFGWPEGGIKVAARPAGDLKLEITGGAEKYSVLELENGEPFLAKVYYQGVQLTGEELKKVELKWDSDSSNVKIVPEFDDEQYKLSLRCKDSMKPADIVCGECSVAIQACYSAPGSDESQAQAPLNYNIDEDIPGIGISIEVPEDYIVISQLDKSEAIVVKLSMNGQPLTAEEFAAVELTADCNGIEHTLTPNAQESSYLIKLQKTDKISEGKYSINVNTTYTDSIGRATKTDDSTSVTLSNMPLWVKWVIRLLILLLLLILIWIILHIRVLPKYMHTTRRLSSMNFDGDDVTQATNFLAEIKQKSARVQGQYAGKKFGVIMDVTPGKESYLYKSQKRRSAVVKVASVKKFGPAKIQEVLIGSAKYIIDEDTGKLVPAIPNQKPFMLTNGMMVKYSGTIQDAGIDKDFEVTSKLNFKKK